MEPLIDFLVLLYIFYIEIPLREKIKIPKHTLNKRTTRNIVEKNVIYFFYII